MRSRPTLIVRYGKGHRVSSPVSTLGYVAQLAYVIALGATIASLVRSHGRAVEWLLFVPIFSYLLFVAARDLAAWTVATEPERLAFRAAVRSARELREAARRAPRPMTRRECAGYLALLAVSAGFFGLVLATVAIGDRAADLSAAAIAAVLLSVWLGGSWAVVRRYRRAAVIR